MRRRGGGSKRQYRIIDFKRDKTNIPAKVATIEYDPNRSALIALLHYLDGEKRYIIAPVGLKVGQTVVSGPEADIISGNALPLRFIPLGTTIHNVELRPGKGAQMVRAAGGAAQLVAKEGDWAQLRLPSGEIRRVNIECYATVGQIGNIEHSNVSFRQSRAHALDRTPPQGSRRRYEPRGPPARRGRGQDLGRTPPRYALGPADARLQDSKQQAHG